MSAVIVPHPALAARIARLVEAWARRRVGFRGTIGPKTRLERDLRLTSDEMFEMLAFVCDELHMEFRRDFSFARQFSEDRSTGTGTTAYPGGALFPLRGMKPFTVELLAKSLQPR